jgi:hypothetical protein
MDYKLGLNRYGNPQATRSRHQSSTLFGMTLSPYRLLKKASLTACVLVTVAVAPATAQKLKDSEKQVILTELDKIEKLLKDGRAKNNARALRAYREAASSPTSSYEFFMQCTKQLEFTDRAKPESEWRKWRDAKAENYRKVGHSKALQFQLKYLILSIRACSIEDDDKSLAAMMPDVISFLGDLSQHYDSMVKYRSTLQAEVMGTVFAERMRLGETLETRNDWTFSPLAFEQIYGQTILPLYRRLKNDSAIQSAWTGWINQETKLASTAENVKIEPGASKSARERIRDQRKEKAREKQMELRDFKDERLPEMQWGKARDAFLYGTNKSASARSMGKLIRDHLDHRAALSWVEELRELAKEKYELDAYFDKAPDE